MFKSSSVNLMFGLLNTTRKLSFVNYKNQHALTPVFNRYHFVPYIHQIGYVNFQILRTYLFILIKCLLKNFSYYQQP